jgi:hypothetical protein
MSQPEEKCRVLMLHDFGQKIAANRASPDIRTVRRKKSNHGLAL